jgi:hypothetical protein
MRNFLPCIIWLLFTEIYVIQNWKSYYNRLFPHIIVQMKDIDNIFNFDLIHRK